MAYFDKASPALKEILLKIHRSEKPTEIDHQLYEFGSVQYHIQASPSEPDLVYLSVSTSLQSPGIPNSDGLQKCTSEALKRVYSDVVDVVDPPKGGYQLTLKINFAKLPHREEKCVKMITDLSSLQAVILSSKLKEMLWSLGSKDTLDRMYKPIKLVYHPGEPFFVIRMPEKIISIFPMRFGDDSDVIIAKTLFQELIDVGYSKACAKAPPCTWSPIPPPELRGESFEDLSTNGGFVSFDIFQRHVKGSKLEKTVWNLLNFYAFVKRHVKCTRGFVQRKLRKKMEGLSEVMKKATIGADEYGADEHITKKNHRGWRCMKKLKRLSEAKMLRRKCGALAKKIKRIRFRIKIHGFLRFRNRFLKVPKFYSLTTYTKLD